MHRNAYVYCFFTCFLTGHLVRPSDIYVEDEEAASTHVPQLLSTPTVIEATIGESVSLPCIVEDLGTYVKLWKKGKANVLFAAELRVLRDDRFQVDLNSLKISSIQPKDSGEYICQISSNPQLEVMHTLNVLYPPSVKPDPKDGFVTVKEGETVTIACESTGNPKPQISWKHAGRNYDVSNGNKFTIVSASKSASGEYECIANNGVGDPATAIITVEVVSAPKVYPKPESGILDVKEGDVIEISCEATGDPRPVISWKTPGGEKPHKSREGNKIVISKAERNHAGAYECIANNTLGVFTSAIIRVNVHYPPEIKIQNPWIHAAEGTMVNMSCSIKGEPMPTAQWRRDVNKVIHPNEHYHIKSSGHHHILQIRHLRKEDFGRYECVGSNTLGTSSDNIHIVGTPQVPIFVSKPHGSDARMYNLEWMVKSPSEVIEYSIRYRMKSDTEEWTAIPILVGMDVNPMQSYAGAYELNGLNPSTSYEAVVTAKNKYGWSKQSDTLIFKTHSAEKRSEGMFSSAHSLHSWFVTFTHTSLIVLFSYLCKHHLC